MLRPVVTLRVPDTAVGCMNTVDPAELPPLYPV